MLPEYIDDSRVIIILIDFIREEMIMVKQNNRIVLQCPNCGARAGLHSGKTHCSRNGHSPMVPAWFASGKLLTAKEIQEQKLLSVGAKDGGEKAGE
jgi:hypothetical protein